MTKNEIPAMLQKLAYDMKTVAAKMGAFRELDTCYQGHARELFSAGAIVDEWADDILALEAQP